MNLQGPGPSILKHRRSELSVAPYFPLFLAYLVCISLVLSESGLAAMPTTIRLSENTFALGAAPKSPFGVAGDSNKNPAPLVNGYSLATKLAEYQNSHSPQNLAEHYRLQAQYGKRIPEILQKTRQYFQDTLKEFASTVTPSEAYIPDGISFYQTLFSSTDPEIQVTLLFILSQPERFQFNQSDLEKMITAIVANDLYSTFLLSTQTVDVSDIQKIQTISSLNNYSHEQIGDYLLLGGGFSFLILREILKSGQSLADASTQLRFQRILKFSSDHLLGTDLSYLYGASAFYTPTQDQVSLVLASSASLNSWSHEITHARFQRLMIRIQSWADKMNLMIPYEIDGPPIPFRNFGGFMNLLNELNSWRIGTSFDVEKTDHEILAILRESYGQQAGEKAAAAFSEIWTAENVAGKSVPKIILETIRRYNKLSEAEIFQLGQDSLINGNLVGQMNFIRLVRQKQRTGFRLSTEFKSLLEIYLTGSQVTDLVRSVINPDEPTVKPRVISQSLHLKRDFFSIWKELMETRNSRLVFELSDRFSGDFDLDHFGKLVELTLDSHYPTAELLILLDKVLNSRGFTSLAFSEKNLYKQREAINSGRGNAWLQALDQILAQQLFEGEIYGHKKYLLSLVIDKTFPVELPKTYSLILNHLLNAAENSNSQKISLSTLMPATNKITNLTWSERLTKDTLAAYNSGEFVSPRVLQTIGESIRIGLPSYFKEGPQFGASTSIQLNRQTYERSSQFYHSLRGRTAIRFKDYVTTIEVLLKNPHPRVQKSARYAVWAFPALLISLEAEIEKLSTSENTRDQLLALRLFSPLSKNFFTWEPPELRCRLSLVRK